MASGVQKAFKHGEKAIWSTKSSNAPYKIGPWKFITKLVAEFFQNIDFRPDNGAHTRFWKDKWLNETILTDTETPPPRITSNLKLNLQFLRLWKEFQQRKSCTPKPATSYRKKKVEKEELPEDEEIYRDPTLALYYTNQVLDVAVPVLLVDGYNVCGYWSKLKKHFMNGSLDIARQKLIDELVSFSLLREVKVVVVFDAMMSGIPTHKENFERRAESPILADVRRWASSIWKEAFGVNIYEVAGHIFLFEFPNKHMRSKYSKESGSGENRWFNYNGGPLLLVAYPPNTREKQPRSGPWAYPYINGLNIHSKK
ncbi:hypothetical protein BC332_25482 [Capsicum chinense]|nr:hypothetical protein BC332_25482 [Capsicum chinense]